MSTLKDWNKLTWDQFWWTLSERERRRCVRGLVRCSPTAPRWCCQTDNQWGCATRSDHRWHRSSPLTTAKVSASVTATQHCAHFAANIKYIYGLPIGQAIVFCSCDFLFLLLLRLSIFLAYSQRLQIGCLPYFHTWCGLSANLECSSGMCCTRLAENTGRKKLPKIRHLRTIAQLCRLYLRNEGTYRQSEKNVC